MVVYKLLWERSLEKHSPHSTFICFCLQFRVKGNFLSWVLPAHLCTEFEMKEGRWQVWDPLMLVENAWSGTWLLQGSVHISPQEISQGLPISSNCEILTQTNQELKSEQSSKVSLALSFSQNRVLFIIFLL